MAALEPDALNPEEPFVIDALASRVHELGIVARRAASDMPVRAGRRREWVRDAALRLAMEVVEEATGKPVTLSRGTRDREGHHFTNAGGHLIRDLFNELGFGQERILAQSAERIRRSP